ncbi:MAG TPA: helix-turn-helix domain-containing protein [Jiangellaceae bacterium]
MAKAIVQPQNARSRRTAEALLAAARAIIEEDGFDSLTMAGVAERAGVSRRAVYLHFDSRAELLAELLLHLGQAEDLGVSLQRVWDSPDSLAALDEWAHHLARAHPRIMLIARAVDQVRRADPDATAMRAEIMRRWRSGCGRLMAWLAAEGNLAPPWTVDTAADMLWALMSWDVLEGLLVEREWSREQYAEHMALLFRAAFTLSARRS